MTRSSAEAIGSGILSQRHDRLFHNVEATVMPVFNMPLILKDDYDAFRCLLQNLPPTYEVWLHRHTGKKDQHILQWGIGSVKITEVEVNPNDFSQYCDRTRADRTLESLDRFAEELAAKRDSAARLDSGH